MPHYSVLEVLSHIACHRILLDISPSWSRIKFSTSAKYLGFFIGPDGYDDSWRGPIRKYMDRISYIRNCSFGISASIYFYNVIAVSTLSYVSQLLLPPPCLFRAESKLLPHITPSPGSWVSAGTLHHVKAFLPFRTNPISICVYSRSIRARTLLSTMPDWASFYNTLHNSTLSDDCLISPPFPNWLKHSAAYTLKDMHTFLCDNHLLHKAHITVRAIRSSIHNLDNPKDTQKHISNWIHSLSAPFSVDHFLAHRWKRWFKRPILDSNIRVAQKIASLTTGFPQNVLNSILRSWLNSWFTARRFQKSSHCLFCRAWLSTDSIEHIAVCPVTNQLSRDFLRNSYDTPSLSLFLLLDARNPIHLALLSLHLHSLFLTHNNLRHHRPHENLQDHLRHTHSLYSSHLHASTLSTPWGRRLRMQLSIST